MPGDGVRADHALSAWEQIKSSVRARWEAERQPEPPTAFSGMSLPWSKAEKALRFGYSAAQWYGRRHPAWSPEIEARLATEWQLYRPDAYRWRDIREVVRQGYQFGLGG